MSEKLCKVCGHWIVWSNEHQDWFHVSAFKPENYDGHKIEPREESE